MESQSMIYIVSEFASQGEIFGKFEFSKKSVRFFYQFHRRLHREIR